MSVNVGEFTEKLNWIVPDVGVRMEELEGKIVLLYFWRMTSSNSVNILEDIRYLENKYDDQIVIIGIHSPSFEAEKDVQLVQQAALRLHIRHLVASDPELEVWRYFGVDAWPGFALVDVHGNLREYLVGEGRLEQLEESIDALVEEAIGEDTMRFEAYEVSHPRSKPRALHYPSAIIAGDERVFICDTGQNRILETNKKGRVLRQFGSGNPGFWDGVGIDVGFKEPQSLTRVGDRLYVADTGNHAIRVINLLNGEVDTLIGTGKAKHLYSGEIKNPKDTSIHSPMAITAHQGDLYVCHTSQQQIWRYTLSKNTYSLIAGCGNPGFSDGRLIEARFMEPMSIVALSEHLYVADAGASSVRRIDLKRQKVETFIGHQGESGDVDGPVSDIRLQYPCRIESNEADQSLWVLDTLNGKVKQIDVPAGMGFSLELDHSLDYPLGISVNQNDVWIVNTNQHEVLCVDIDSERAIKVPIEQTQQNLDAF
ncbi:MAG: thioredoxin-like domain-containing protein [bacterium]